MVFKQAFILASCIATRYAVKVTRRRYGFERQEADVRVEEGRAAFGNKKGTVWPTH